MKRHVTPLSSMTSLAKGSVQPSLRMETNSAETGSVTLFHEGAAHGNIFWDAIRKAISRPSWENQPSNHAGAQCLRSAVWESKARSRLPQHPVQRIQGEVKVFAISLRSSRSGHSCPGGVQH